MKISITNVFTDAGTLVVNSDNNVLFDINTIESSDFSTSYTSNGTSINFAITKTWDVNVEQEYVAISGHNLGLEGGGTLELRVNGIPYGGDFAVFDAGSFSHVVMFTFPKVVINAIEIKFAKNIATDQITVTNVQTGLLFDFVSPINNQERSGYRRAWMDRARRIRTINNEQAGPVASLTRKISHRVTLSIADLQDQDTDPDQPNMFNFMNRVSIATTWYIKERDGTSLPDDPKSSYMCFQGDASLTAGSRSQLNNFKLTFNAFTGT
jgi:hypothetical protein